MNITAKQWKRYIDLRKQLRGKARDEMQEWIDQNGLTDIEAAINMAHALITKYGEGEAAVAAEMYDAIANAEGARVPEAIAAEPATKIETEIAVKQALKFSPAGRTVPGKVEMMVKQAGEDTIIQNAKRDKAEFAWIPSGGETCAFCLTLASNGWRRASKKTIQGNHATHIHANCDCSFAIRFNSSTEVAGYDPDKYLKLYQDADGHNSHTKINYMRREMYKDNKDDLNARRREIYEEDHKDD